MDYVAMETDQGAVAALGAAVGTVLYAGAEIVRRIRNKAPQDDPVIKQMQADMASVSKTLRAVTAQLEYLAEDHHQITKRVAKIEQNGKKK